jgi:SAM-dependent methyltransferase
MRSRLKNLNRHIIDRAVAAFAARLPAGVLMLDIGAGGGHYRCYFGNQRYLAIDRGYEQPGNAGLDVTGDIRQMPYATGSVGAAICIEVIEHVFETRAFLDEVTRVLAPGAPVLLTSPLCYGEHMHPWDFHRFTRFALERLFAASGLELTSLEPRGGIFTLTAYLIARLPDELARRGGWRARLVKPFARLIFTYLLAPFLLLLDHADTRRHFTLGYICVACKRQEPTR